MREGSKPEGTSKVASKVKGPRKSSTNKGFLSPSSLFLHPFVIKRGKENKKEMNKREKGKHTYRESTPEKHRRG
jgi:hypothetical protein